MLEEKGAIAQPPSDVVDMLDALQAGAQEALGANLIALYLRGTFFEFPARFASPASARWRGGIFWPPRS